MNAFQCTTCGRVFEAFSDCRTHAARHRTKPSQKLPGSQKQSDDKFVREVRIERTESEGITLHQVAGESPPDDPETEYLVDKDPNPGEESRLTDFVGEDSE